MNAFSLPRPFWKSKESKEHVLRIQSLPEPTESKLKYILGITDAELQTARSRSLSSGSTARLYSASFSEATTAPSSSDQTTHSSPKLDAPLSVEVTPSAVLLEESSDSATALPKLHTYTSSSTLRSRYDRQNAPITTSQQTSDSSSRDFALRKGTPSVLSVGSQEIEPARRLRFFTPQKPRANESRQSKRLSNACNDKYAQMSPVLSTKSSPVWPQVAQSSSSVTPSAPASPQSMTPVRRFFVQRPTSEAQPIHQPIIRDISTTPFAKVHVRRPKIGARHWFDGLEGDSSDDESSGGSKQDRSFFNDVERALEEITNHTSSTTVPEASEISPPVLPGIYSQTKSSVPERVIIPSGSASLELPAPKATQESAATGGETQPYLNSSKSSSHDMAGIDLNQQSVLILASSEDEEDVDEAPSVVFRPARIEPIIRESIMAETIADSEVEVGLARTIQTTPIETVTRSLPLRTEWAGKVSYSPFPVPARPSARSRTSRPVDLPSAREMSESDIITAFPATPSEGGSRTTSIRTSGAFSDNTSVRSTRMMQVTKQEQRLLTAMRSKKAAMWDADRAADRQCALTVLESGEGWSNLSVGQGHILPDDHSGLDNRLRNRYAPSRGGPIHRRSFSGGATVNTRESGTTFQTSTDSYSRRGSHATWRSDFSDDVQTSYTAHKDHSHRVNSQASQRPPSEGQSRRMTVRDTFLSMASDSSSQQRNSHIVMLDELDESLERESIPSQLFLETPFIGWDRIGLAAAH